MALQDFGDVAAIVWRGSNEAGRPPALTCNDWTSVSDDGATGRTTAG